MYNLYKNKSCLLNRKGFSVAEAMIVLLITSLALAAASPLISKMMKSSGSDKVEYNNLEDKIENLEDKLEILEDKLAELETIPSGSVVFFNLANCPTGWKNATTLGWGGRFFRVADSSNPRNVLQEDMIKSHSHLYQNFGITWIGQGGGCPSGTCNAMTQRSSGSAGSSSSFGENETRPKNVPLTACIKN